MEPLLNWELCRTFLPPKSEEHKLWNEPQNIARVTFTLNKQPKDKIRVITSPKCDRADRDEKISKKALNWKQRKG